MYERLSRLPKGRPPTRPSEVVVGWKERREHIRRAKNGVDDDAPPPERVLRGTPETRARTPFLSQQRTRHNPDAPAVLVDGKVELARTTEFAILWQCSVCTSWTRDPVRVGYLRCDTCQCVSVRRVFVFPAPHVDFFRLHAAEVQAAAAMIRAHRHDSISGRPNSGMHKYSIRTVDFFREIAADRDVRLLAPRANALASLPQEWLTQVFLRGQRYLGASPVDYCRLAVWPSLVDVLGQAAPSLPEVAFTESEAEGIAPAWLPTPRPPRRPAPNEVLPMWTIDAEQRLQEQLQLELRATLETTQLVTVHLAQSNPGRLMVLFTVADGLTQQWLRLLAHALPWLGEFADDVFVGQRYLTHQGQVMAPWLLTIDAKGNLPDAVASVRHAFLRASDALVNGPHPEPKGSSMAGEFYGLWMAEAFEHRFSYGPRDLDGEPQPPDVRPVARARIEETLTRRKI